MARPATASRHEKLQTALLDAAEQVIAMQGLSALRARALADQVGCSVGAIYTIFPDLDGIILAVNARTLTDIDTALSGANEVSDPASQLVHLAHAYLAYAAGHRSRWAALFQHTMANGCSAPDWYARQQEAAFSHIEAPLARLCPDLAPQPCALLARSLFAAVHGMVALGLDEKVAAMPLPVLQDQVATVVSAMARGLIESAATPKS
ncbi:TetR/AcrR family transcriptional regulator [Acidisphaera sp. L21]|uniref:TetR/AcrR family transcriptional regulator n=1 Tax=Acidisphaera sp. L21 TaxID=1641851 RepID=UPI00131ACE95|nr:TetR/AcrR family transcriptional regulator [Acidisphaera sp. L21]